MNVQAVETQWNWKHAERFLKVAFLCNKTFRTERQMKLVLTTRSADMEEIMQFCYGR